MPDQVLLCLPVRNTHSLGLSPRKKQEHRSDIGLSCPTCLGSSHGVASQVGTFGSH